MSSFCRRHGRRPPPFNSQAPHPASFPSFSRFWFILWAALLSIFILTALILTIVYYRATRAEALRDPHSALVRGHDHIYPFALHTEHQMRRDVVNAAGKIIEMVGRGE